MATQMVNMNIPKEWDTYVTQTNMGLEQVPSMLWDTLTYTDNVTTNLVFFQQTNVNQDISNMRQSGMLPNPEAFLIQTIRIFFKTAITTVDMAASGASLVGAENDKVILSNTGVARLQIGNKNYGPWPMFTLPSGSGYFGLMAAAGAEAASQVSGYGQIGGPLYPLFPNLMLSPLQPFNFTLVWPSGAVDLSTNMVITIIFDGQLARSIQ